MMSIPPQAPIRRHPTNPRIRNYTPRKKCGEFPKFIGTNKWKWMFRIGIIITFIFYISILIVLMIVSSQMMKDFQDQEEYNTMMDDSSIHDRFDTNIPTQQQQQQQQYIWELCDPLHTTNINLKKNPCDYYFFHNATITTTNTNTTPSTIPFVFHINNTFSMTRYLCRDISIPAFSNMTLSSSELLKACGDEQNDSTIHIRIHKMQPSSWMIPSRLFEFPPLDMSTSLSSAQYANRTLPPPPLQNPPPISPISVRFGRRPPTQLFPDCDIPCYHDGEPISDRYVDVMDGTGSTTWTISFSMEGPQYWSSLYIQPDGWKEDRFWSTTSYQSEVPLPYYDNVSFHIWHNDFVPYNTGIHGGLFMAFNCASKNYREQIVMDMIHHHFRVDAVSSCLHNADPPNGMNNELGDKISIMKQYLFYLAFENQCEDDYITEKLWGAYEAGTIPIYYGAPNVKDHVPNHSLIHVNDYNTTYDLVQHVLAVMNDRQMYESYHKWRTQPIPEHFHTKYDFTTTHSTCRTCRWAYARVYGVGWNHTTQSLRPLHIGLSRQACLSSIFPSSSNNQAYPLNYLVQHPFVEEWYDADGTFLHIAPTIVSDESIDTSTECSHPVTDANRMIDIDHGVLQRTLYNHDGVVDMIIRESAEAATVDERKMSLQPVTLRLHFPLLRPPVQLRNIRPGVWHVQNEKSRFTILFATSFSSSDDIAVTEHTEIAYNIVMIPPIRVRVIVEDVDTFHKGANDTENFFGKLLTDDFFNPIQISVGIPVA